ncbi:MAG TPA: PIG-L deacetylase family protein [Acidimicrobiales bacterium]|nr:PIG-L deacetylase family protein [Acidimicrobiales bacterium]
MTDERPVERILVVVAHPDDVDFGAAGSVATWTGQGITVSYCVVTDGDAGGFDRAVPRREMAAMRHAEQEASARRVGVTDVRYLGYPDGRLVTTLELRRDISRVIRQVRPQRVVTQSPVRNLARIFASHPDHLAAGEATVSAVYPDSRNPFAFPELLEEGHEPWTVDEIWLMASTAADVYVDITDTYARKVEALLCHVSQLPDPESTTARIHAWAAAVASDAGLEDGRLAEAFQRVVTSL